MNNLQILILLQVTQTVYVVGTVITVWILIRRKTKSFSGKEFSIGSMIFSILELAVRNCWKYFFLVLLFLCIGGFFNWFIMDFRSANAFTIQDQLVLRIEQIRMPISIIALWLFFGFNNKRLLYLDGKYTE